MSEERMKKTMVRVLDAEAESLRSLQQVLDYDTAVRLINLIAECAQRGGRVIVTGCGTSAVAAKKIVHSFCCIEISALFLSPADAVHGALGVVRKGDVVIIISKGGGTPELVRLIPSLKTKEAAIIGVGENPLSSIGSASDLFIQVRVEREPDLFNMLATASTMAVIAVFDAITVALMEHTDFTREQFAVIHPSGAVGDRLLKGEK
jgi:KpsF/GutQ family protein